MLAPRDTPTRERKSLDGLWRFALDPDGDGRAQQLARRPAARGARGARPRQLQRHLHRPRGARPRRRGVVPDDRPRACAAGPASGSCCASTAATHRAAVWVDGQEVVEHEGGYTPFEAEVTDLVEPGGEHRITVVVDNILSWQIDPAGLRGRDAGRAAAALFSLTSSTTPDCTGLSGLLDAALLRRRRLRRHRARRSGGHGQLRR